MLSKYAFIIVLVAASILAACQNNKQIHAVSKTQDWTVEKWLQTDPALRPAFDSVRDASSTLALSSIDYLQMLFYADRSQQLKQALEQSWEKQVFTYQGQQMPIKYILYGNKTEGNRSLFISMHGGGATAASVNDQQWNNQIRLYQPEEGIYLAPRAPTNTWNLWHQAHVDPLLDQIIYAAVLFAGVDQGKVYLTGYSAGGDGTFQLSARMSDRFAAAAMMAGHPNEIKPESMRNIPFALYMGADDTAYERNKRAQEWKEALANLQRKDTAAYKHQVEIVANKGHWMDRADTAAIDWMQQFRRTAQPSKIVWIQDDVHQEQSYWLRIPKQMAQTGQKIVVSNNNNHLKIEQNYADSLFIMLNHNMIDMQQPLRVSVGDKLLFEGEVNATAGNIYRCLQRRFDYERAYPICLLLLNNEKILLNPDD